MLKYLLIPCFALAVACAHTKDESNHSVTESLRELGKDVSVLMASTNTPNSAEDPTSVRSRVHSEIVPLRERLAKLRERTNNNVKAQSNDTKAPSAQETEENAKIQAELDRLENQLNALEHPEQVPPAAEQ